MNEVAMSKVTELCRSKYPNYPFHFEGPILLVPPDILTEVGEAEAYDPFADYSKDTPAVAGVRELICEASFYLTIDRFVLERGIKKDQANCNSAADVNASFERLISKLKARDLGNVFQGSWQSLARRSKKVWLDLFANPSFAGTQRFRAKSVRFQSQVPDISCGFRFVVPINA